MKHSNICNNTSPIFLNNSGYLDNSASSAFSNNINKITNTDSIISRRIQSWDDSNILTKRTDSPYADPREYPKGHDKYDLAELKHWKEPGLPKMTKKAEKKYNINHLALVDKDNLESKIELFYTSKELGGLPGYIDAFLKGEKGGRTEGFSLHPEQFAATSFSTRHGGFIISPNPSNIPEKGQSYTNDTLGLLSKTRENGTGFGLVCYWIPAHQYEKYEIFNKLFPDAPASEIAPEIMVVDTTRVNREKRLDNYESNKEYKERTGCDFLAIPLNLKEEHIPLLQDLKSTITKHLMETYQCNVDKEKVEIYTHSPIYANNSCGLHFHVRVNEGRHSLEMDLRNLKLDDLIQQLSDHGKATHIPVTRLSNEFISYNIGAKMKDAKAQGISFTPVPNPWRSPDRKVKTNFIKNHLNFTRDIETITTSNKSEAKYNVPYIGLIKPEGMYERISRYGNNTILPNFIYNFMIGSNKDKNEAFFNKPEQFPATTFGEDGGIFLMPNPKYVPGKREYFDNPEKVISETRHTGGIALVGYWVPPELFEGTTVFNDLFSKKVTVAQPLRKRETIHDYNKRTENKFITNPIDLKKRHIPMLEEFKTMGLKNLKDVYGVTIPKDKVDMYVHAPLYGNKTAGFHIHVRVNQRLPAGEQDANRMGLDTVIETLKREDISDDEMQNTLLNQTFKTKNDSFYSFSSAWDRQSAISNSDGKSVSEGKQFKGIPVNFIPNPWARPQ